MAFSCYDNTDLSSLTKFMMGAHFLEACILLRSADNLKEDLLKEVAENRISEYQYEFNNKKLVNNKETTTSFLTPIFLTIKQNKPELNTFLRTKFRRLEFVRPERSHITNYTKMVDIEGGNCSSLISKVFECIQFLDQGSFTHKLCID